MSLISCKGFCQHKAFEEKFKVLKQLSGKIGRKIRRFYRYCSKCQIFARWITNHCSCCGITLRRTVKNYTRSQLTKRWRQSHPEQYRLTNLTYYQKNKELLRKKRMERYYLNKK